MIEQDSALETDVTQSADNQTATYPHWFQMPTSEEIARYRITDLKSKVAEISRQLDDVSRQDTMATRDYLAWRAKAKRAMSFSTQETRLLGQWIFEQNQQKHAAKGSTTTAKADHQERMRALLCQAERMGPIGLINALYLIVKELRTTHGFDLAPEMWAVMDAAQSYCETVAMRPEDLLRTIEVPA